MDTNSLVAQKIKQTREELGYKSGTVAHEIEMSEAAYCQLESGNTQITVEKLCRLSQIFKKPITFFFPETQGNVFHIEKVDNSTLYNGSTIQQTIDPKIANTIEHIGKILLESIKNKPQ